MLTKNLLLAPPAKTLDGHEIVRPDGRHPSAARLLGRSFLLVVPGMALSLLYYTGHELYLPEAAAAVVLVYVTSGAVLFLSPDRGLAERLSGTRLVPEGLTLEVLNEHRRWWDYRRREWNRRRVEWRTLRDVLGRPDFGSWIGETEDEWDDLERALVQASGPGRLGR